MDTLFRRFANLLVNEDFSEASLMLSVACRYTRNGRCVEGREEIVNCLRSSAVWARNNFDLVLHDHTIATDPFGNLAIIFTDILELKNAHTIQQSIMHLEVDREGFISEFRTIECTKRPNIGAFIKSALPSDTLNEDATQPKP